MDPDPAEGDREMRPQEGLGAVPGIARIAAGAWLRGAAWGVGTTLKAGRRLSEAAVSGSSAGELLEDLQKETAAGLRQVLGLAEDASPSTPLSDAFAAVRPDRPEGGGRAAKMRSLRERGGELLERAADVDDDRDPVHPGFSRIVDQLAPDEARILKLLINDGAQGIVYVHRAAPLGIGARAVARRLSMIGSEAGCLHPELVPAYIDNLVRLGLVAIRRDPLEDELPYQVIEAQPEVIEALRSAGAKGHVFRGQISRRSAHLTEFGRTFCQVCFPPEHLTGEFEAIEPAGAEAASDPLPSDGAAD